MVGQDVVHDSEVVTGIIRRLLRLVFILTTAFGLAFLLSHFARRTDWFKDRLYHQLLTGNEDERLRAVSVLADVGAEAQLLQGLKVRDEEISEMARRGLDHLWFSAAGRGAYALMESAYALAEEQQFTESIVLLDRLLAQYPNYAEGLNRRAAAFWQLGEYEKSRRDCERALVLNPNHYGAWQGLGVSQLQLGDYSGAWQSLQNALAISPNDKVAQRCLKKLEELLRGQPSQPGQPNQPASPREADLL